MSSSGSTFSLNRLGAMRRYKAAVHRGLSDSGAVESLPAEYLSQRGLTRRDMVERVTALRDCASVLEISDSRDGKGDDLVVSVARANWCKIPAACPVCSTRVQSRRRAIYGPAVGDAVRSWPHAYMMTFTVLDGPDVGERLDHLRASFRRWYRMGQRRGDRRSGGESGKLAAALTGTELVRTAAGLWHVHLHALVFTDSRLDYRIYDPRKLRAARRASHGRRLSDAQMGACVSEWNGDIPVSKLSREWIAASGDSCNVDVEPIRGGIGAIKRSALEVLKYCSKLAGGVESWSDGAGDLLDLVAGTYGRRLFAALRGFRGLVRPDAEYDSGQTTAYSLVWDDSLTAYRPGLNGRRVPSLLSALQESGKIIGAWRRERRQMLAQRFAGLPDVLNRCKDDMRHAVSNVWRKAQAAALVVAYRLPPPDLPPPDPVQLSLFPA